MNVFRLQLQHEHDIAWFPDRLAVRWQAHTSETTLYAGTVGSPAEFIEWVRDHDEIYRSCESQPASFKLGLRALYYQYRTVMYCCLLPLLLFLHLVSLNWHSVLRGAISGIESAAFTACLFLALLPVSAHIQSLPPQTPGMHYTRARLAMWFGASLGMCVGIASLESTTYRYWIQHFGGVVVISLAACFATIFLAWKYIPVVAAALQLGLAIRVLMLMEDLHWSIAISLLGLTYYSVIRSLRATTERESGLILQGVLNVAKTACLMQASISDSILSATTAAEGRDQCDVEEEISKLSRCVPERNDVSDVHNERIAEILTLQDIIRNVRYSRSLRIDLMAINRMLVPLEAKSAFNVKLAIQKLLYDLLAFLLALNLIVVACGGRPGLWILDIAAVIMMALTNITSLQ